MIDLSSNPLLDIIAGIGDSENFFRDKVAERFNRETRGSDLNVLRAYQKHTPFCVDIDNLNAKLDKLQVPDQPLYVDFFNRSLETTPNNLQDNNYDRGSSLRYQVVIGDILVEKMSLNGEALARFDFLGSSSDAEVFALKYRAARQYLFVEAYRSLLNKMNDAAVTHLLASISTGGGVGTVYPAGATNTNVKEIPFAERLDKYTGIMAEAKQNRFLYNGEKPFLLSSTLEFLDRNKLEALGTANSSDEKTAQLALFEHMSSDSLDAAVGAYNSISFLMAKGAVAVTSYAQNMSGAMQEMSVADRRFSKIQIPDIGTEYGIDSARGLGGFNFNYEETRAIVDDFATYATEESRLNAVTEMKLWTRPVFIVASQYNASAPFAATAQTAVIQYGQLAV